MSDGVLTLRVIPANFRSVLFDDLESWRLDAGQMTAPSDVGVLPSQPTVPGSIGRGKRTRPRTGLTAVSHSAERVANAIVLATNSPIDLRTLNAWGQHVGISRGALRVWCKAAGVSARECLDFLRVLRAVIVSETQPWDLLSILDVVDARSLAQLLARGGVRELGRAKQPPTVAEFLARQRFLRDDRLVDAVARRLARPT